MVFLISLVIDNTHKKFKIGVNILLVIFVPFFRKFSEENPAINFGPTWFFVSCDLRIPKIPISHFNIFYLISYLFIYSLGGEFCL